MISEKNETFTPVNETTLQQTGLIKTEDGFVFRDLNKNDTA